MAQFITPQRSCGLASGLSQISPMTILWLLLTISVARDLITMNSLTWPLGLMVDYISLKERTVLVELPTKNRSERVVFFPKYLVPSLQEYFLLEEEKKNAFNMSRMKFDYLIKQLRDFVPREKKKGFSLHSLRHSMGNMLAEQGVDVRIAQKLLGHKDIQSTLIYYDPDINTIKKIYNERVK